MLNILLGPPGTGKTETCLRTVERHLEQGTPPDRIGYFAFTRRANTEAKERAMARFKLASNDLPYFKTLHSLAFSRMGISRNQLMTEGDYAEIAKWLKVPPFFTAKATEKDYGYGDKILELINIARVTRSPLAHIYNHSTVKSLVDWATLDYVNRGLNQYKKASSRYDYSDLLESFVQSNIAPALEVLIIDEAQDLSALQWMMVDQMARKAKHVYIAGDDDQAIYRWAGADVEQFIHKEGTVHVLNQSYRIPLSHHAISQELIHRVLDRRAKEFKPREDAGTVTWHRHSEEVDLAEGDWLLLSRTRAGANQLEEEVRQRGLLYAYEGGYSADAKALEAVMLWEQLRLNRRLDADSVRKVYAMMTPNKEVESKHRILPNVDNDTYLSLDDLRKHHGLLTTDPWREALSRIPDDQKRYISACLRKGETLESKPRITISTIHRAKGAQATNVLMTTDVPKRKSMLWRQEEFDDEARVFYVGLTRAKKALHLIHPMRSAGYAIPHGEACSAVA
jgi:superfamily I DNA/RNA helicase